MKVKEAYSNEFKQPIKTLKIVGDLEVIEQKEEREELPYSTYLIYDKKLNESFISIYVPDPKINDTYKDIYLKYQHGARNFCLDFVDVLAGKRKDLDKIYTIKQPDEFKLKQEGRSATIKTIKDEYLFAIVDFIQDTDLALNVADNFIKYFKGEEATFKKAFGYKEG